MRMKILLNIAFIVSLFFINMNVYAQLPDRYIGDTAIYYSSGGPKPNVLFVLENSRYVANFVGGIDIYAYDPDNPYSGNLAKDSIYTSNNFVNFKYEFPFSSVTDSCDGLNPSFLLETYGSYYGALDSSGQCINKPKKNDIQYYYLGDYVNYLKQESPTVAEWMAGTNYELNDVVAPTDNSELRYYVTQAGQSGDTEPDWPHLSDVTDLMSEVVDGGVVWRRSETFLNLIVSVFKASSEIMSTSLKFGTMIFDNNNQGGQVWTEIMDLEEGDNLQTFQDDAEALTGVSLASAALNPVNVMLYDALNYYKNGGGNHGVHWCQESHVILIANGGHRADQNLISVVGGSGTSAEVATWGSEFGVKTHVVQLGAIDNVLQAAAANGGGEYHVADSYEDLEQSVKGILESIVREQDTVFVAPVVPANPENQTFSGDYVYLGLFKPENDRPWSGNLKKFGLDDIDGSLEVVDKNYGFDSPPDDPEPYLVFSDDNRCKVGDSGSPVAYDDSGICGISSYWSVNDSILVDFGGAGGQLVSNTSSPDSRNVKTLIGDGFQDFNIDNENIDAALLDLELEDEVDPLIQFVRGYNTLDEDADPSTIRPWIMGDVLHSRPLVVNYNKTDQEDKTYLFVGTNGGMLHAFDDADGGEEWAFIPDAILPKLKYLDEAEHSYFVDGSASIYIHDDNGNGIIETGDKAILVFGLRRGGGWQDLDYTGSHGAYYALDVTDPENPLFLWKIDNNTAGFSELAQTWSQPQFAKIKEGEGDNVVTKVVAFVGAGYDNVEDLRFGSTDTYPESRVTGPTQDFSQGQSSGLSTATNAVTRGRAVYAIEMATLGGSVNTDNSGELLWSFDGTNHSIPSDVLVLDRNSDGFADRIYFSDLGGNVWRTKLFGGSDLWETVKIFSSNPGQTNGTDDATTGRKLFYRMDASIINSQKVVLYFGSGDRAHPLNHQNPGPSGAVIDRLYSVIDYDGYDYAPNANGPLTEDDLHDVTDNVLQQEQGANESDAVYSARIGQELTDIRDASGWYIRLDFNAGEKVTATPTLFNNVVYFTTYQPDPYGGSEDPCAMSLFNLGTARLYAVNAETGEAVFDFRTEPGTDEHGESQDSMGDDPTLRRADRSVAIGIGMPSGVVVVISEEGNAHLLIVVEQEGGGISQFSLLDDSWQRVRSLYWMQW